VFRGTPVENDCSSAYFKGKGSTGRIMSTQKKWSTPKSQLINTCQPVVKKVTIGQQKKNVTFKKNGIHMRQLSY
jgi:hypothetical protein